jgi:butyryl-CoA dehydrogenase
MILTPEQEMIRDTLRQFAQERLAPNAAEWERTRTFPRAALAELAELGVNGHGGPGTVGRRGPGLSVDGAGHRRNRLWPRRHLHHRLRAKFAGLRDYPEIRQRGAKTRYLTKLASGEWLGCFCLTEPHTGSDAAAMRTTARRDGDQWVLNGVKQFITTGKEGQLAIVFAVTDKNAGKKGISCFLVPTDTPGYIVARLEEKMGQHASDTAQILFENCRSPARKPARSGGEGYKIALVQSGSRPDRHRRPVGGHGARRLRSGGQLRQGTRSVRCAHRSASSGAVPAGRHGDPNRSRPADWSGTPPACGDANRPVFERSLDGQAVRV